MHRINIQKITYVYVDKDSLLTKYSFNACWLTVIKGNKGCQCIKICCGRDSRAEREEEVRPDAREWEGWTIRRAIRCGISLHCKHTEL